MKVLHVSSGEVYGGIETVLASLARYQDLCPELVHHFALCFEGRLSEELREFGAPVYMLGSARLNNPISVRKARRALALVIENSACDIVICHGPRSMVFFAATVRVSRLPLVMWAHGVKTGWHWLNWLVRRIPPDLVICNSQYTRQVFSAHFPSAMIAVVHYPIEMNLTPGGDTRRARVREELRTSEDALVIVHVSRMVAWKGHRLLIDALSDLRADRSWQCWVVGGAQTASELTYLRELETRVQAEKLDDRISFLGQRNDVAEILAAADIFCQANEQADSFGVVFVEAMMAGLPVVTSALGGAIEVVNPDSGILIPPDDRFALSQALGTLLSDSSTRRRFSAGGPAQARRLCEPVARLDELRTTLDALRLTHSPGEQPVMPACD